MRDFCVTYGRRSSFWAMTSSSIQATDQRQRLRGKEERTHSLPDTHVTPLLRKRRCPSFQIRFSGDSPLNALPQRCTLRQIRLGFQKNIPGFLEGEEQNLPLRFLNKSLSPPGLLSSPRQFPHALGRVLLILLFLLTSGHHKSYSKHGCPSLDGRVKILLFSNGSRCS